MMHGLYEFKEQDAIGFAHHVGIQARRRNGQLHFIKCPYCGQMTNDKNTFAIDLRTGKFCCLRSTCGVKGNMITLAKDFDYSLGNIVDEYYAPKKQYREPKKIEKPIVPKPEAIAYLEKRGISKETAERYQITVQTDRPNVLVFPFIDEHGYIQTIKYRKTDFDKSKDTSKEWFEPGMKPILFGMNQCNLENKTLVITEGQMDSLSLAEAGIENAVSVPNGAKGFTWIPYCWDFVNQFETIIVFGDYEHGNITLLDEIRSRFKQNIKHIPTRLYKAAKDANELLVVEGKGYLQKCVGEAQTAPTQHIRSLADVEDVNVFDIPKLATGIRQLDQLLYGGIPFGGVTLIAGKPGEGKSTLASQILINAADTGHRCFAYSGELPNHLFKAWMNFQVAGSKHIYTYKSAFGDEGYTISDSNKKLIDAWYRDKIDIYDSTYLTDDESEEVALTDIIEQEIQKNGADVILIDNLMTALDLESSQESDKYEKQSKFVKRLTRLALRYNVLILLVAHKRKNNISTNANDEISGSGDIANLGMVTISYEKSSDIDDSQRLLKLSKNRLFGKTNTEGWVLDYSEKSKRIFGENDDPSKEYGWCPITVDEDIPF